MAVITSLLLLLALHQTSADSVTDGTELLFSFMVHRHGDRTPFENVARLANVSDELVPLVAPWGYGELTNVGRRTGYKTGQFIRRRYDELLSETYNKSEIYIRSTDSTRTKMTVLSAMAAVYPAVGDTWSDDINWVPVPYTTVPEKYDFNLALLNCPVLSKALDILSTSPSSRMVDFADVTEQISEIIGRNKSTEPGMTFAFYDLYVSELSLGMDLGEKIMTLMPRYEEAAAVAIDILWGDEKYIRLQAGVLLKEFFDAANSVMAGKDVPKVRVYSGHDFNVYSFESVTGVNRQGAPKYGSLLSLELRRVTATGQYVVLPVYLSSPYLNETYLTVKNCGGDVLCDLDTFFDLNSKYIMDEDTWRKSCGLSSNVSYGTYPVLIEI